MRDETNSRIVVFPQFKNPVDNQLIVIYLKFLSDNFNGETVSGLMCRNQLSVDYYGNIYDCDFTQMEGLPALNAEGQPLKVTDFLAAGRLDLIPTVQTDDYCYGCTAGCGSSCGGSLT